VLRGFLGFAALSCFYFAVVRLPLADAMVIHFTNPVFTALIAAVILGEHIGLRESSLVLASLAGVAIVARPEWLAGQGSGLDPVAVGVGLAGALLAAGAYVAVRRLRGEPPMLVVFYFAFVSTLLSLPMVALNPVRPSRFAWSARGGRRPSGTCRSSSRRDGDGSCSGRARMPGRGRGPA
jgi:drug/metabolite transporter (DMT)-like permease